MKILYILSPSQSGSTLLALLLGHQQGLFCGGELDVFSSKPVHVERLPHRLCSCHQKTWRECHFWSAIDQFIFDNHKVRLNELDVDAQDSDTFHKHNSWLYEALSSISQSSIIVDSSKNLERYQRLKKASFDLIPIRLQRNPKAVVYSWISRNKQWKEEDRNHHWRDVATYYTAYYANIEKVTSEKSTVDITYDALVNSPKEVIQKVLRYASLDVSSVDLNWSNNRTHHLSGNPMRYEHSSTIVHHEKWKKGLTFFQRLTIAFIAWPTRYRSLTLHILWKWPIKLCNAVSHRLELINARFNRI